MRTSVRSSAAVRSPCSRCPDSSTNTLEIPKLLGNSVKRGARSKGAPRFATVPREKPLGELQVDRRRTGDLSPPARVSRRGLPYPGGQHDPDAPRGRLALREQGNLRSARAIHEHEPPGVQRAASRRCGGVRIPVPGRRSWARKGSDTDPGQASRRNSGRYSLYAERNSVRKWNRAAPGIRHDYPGRSGDGELRRSAVRLAEKGRSQIIPIWSRARAPEP